MARLDDALATIEAAREARLQLEARTARLEADLCARDASPPARRAPRSATCEFRELGRRHAAETPA